MPLVNFSNLDFDQIKESIKDYLRANSNFTDYDFEGSNLTTIIDTLAYNTYITAFNSNMVANESFLDSATLRENVVSLARNIGYVPRSKTAAKATVSFTVDVSTTASQLILKAGLVCVGAVNNSAYTFSVPGDVSANIVNNQATFTDLEICQGTYLTKEFIVDTSQDQRFILNNPNIDTTTIKVRIGTKEYKQVDNIITVDKESEIYLIQEVADEKYELLFGDGIIGKKLSSGDVIQVSYIVTDGENGNGPSLFKYSGTTTDSNGLTVSPISTPSVTTTQKAIGGGSIEPIDSIKYFAPRVYSSQYRAVTAKDYEAIIQQVFPSTESVAVVGGEELDPPEFGKVVISIKPKNGYAISDFAKTQILNDLKQYTVSGVKQELSDLKLLFVELESDVFYDSSKITDIASLRSSIIASLTKHSKTVDMNKFGGRFRYSKVLQIIDNVDTSITSNITKVKMRRNMNCITNTFAQYEICFGNKFFKKLDGSSIKSTGFKVAGETETVYFLDVPVENSDIGILSIVKPTLDPDTFEVVKKSIGTVDYKKGEIIVNTINITSTDLPENVVEIQAIPDSNDVIGLKDLYLIFDVSKSTINMVKDTIASGEQISGVNFPVKSSYLNGKITR